ncbi:MAG: tRNA preQ1(34) S-adenosylmethionine ribosyltransferase-isomerase QueA [Opitutae bacterium]|nr:tRNA preQ1(34) S-adenosylmethionine ribosyltransferase-isomerase QueA [Opitutae bacterium]|tara:strand:- start:8245 stop:9306 length:1062 start_codon:yes stop_codon:yes gene_type:complete
MLTKELDYDLPEESIAQFPIERRDHSRLLVYDRVSGETRHSFFHELPDLIPAETSFFRNDVSVLKARLMGIRPSGGNTECLLLRPENTTSNTWSCLLKPGAKTEKAGRFSLPGEYAAIVQGKNPSGEYLVRFDLENDDSVDALAKRIGAMPLPPYIRRPTDNSDDERYQTVYSNPKSCTGVAAPTAGLHFTPELLDDLQRRGHPIHDLTLSVGVGTFRPIDTERIADHPMGSETYELSPEIKASLRETGSCRLAVGTTTVRAIEDYLGQGEDSDLEQATIRETKLFIQPPRDFRGVDLLLTNFHLPRSTLLCLVAAFLSPGEKNGLSILKELYSDALAMDYRFYSYGDAMLIL